MGTYRKISNGALTHRFISSSFTLNSNCSLSPNQLLNNETHIRAHTHKKTLSQHRAIFTLLQEQSFPTISVPQPRSAEKGEILRKLVSCSTETSTPPPCNHEQKLDVPYISPSGQRQRQRRRGAAAARHWGAGGTEKREPPGRVSSELAARRPELGSGGGGRRS